MDPISTVRRASLLYFTNGGMLDILEGIKTPEKSEQPLLRNTTGSAIASPSCDGHSAM